MKVAVGRGEKLDGAGPDGGGDGREDEEWKKQAKRSS
jgi:hypothetical protein